MKGIMDGIVQAVAVVKFRDRRESKLKRERCKPILVCCVSRSTPNTVRTRSGKEHLSNTWRSPRFAMGWAYAGQYGILAGSSWAWLVNFQDMQPWFKRPWLYGSGMLVGYAFAKAADSWQDAALVAQIKKYEARGYVLPEDRKKLFEPRTYT